MKLIEPTIKYKDSWQEALIEFQKEELHGFWNIEGEPKDLESYIKMVQNHAQGKDLPNAFVPNSSFWLIDKGHFVGHINIRHKLNDGLKKIGGHLGYYIRPTERKKGYGTKILELGLKKAKDLGIKKALITCYESNIGSQKVIERNGGILQEKEDEPETGEVIMRYWITL